MPLVKVSQTSDKPEGQNGGFSLTSQEAKHYPVVDNEKTYVSNLVVCCCGVSFRVPPVFPVDSVFREVGDFVFRVVYVRHNVVAEWGTRKDREGPLPFRFSGFSGGGKGL